jgi:acyl-coenzyme A synthetase/AMP-(fatty) acid ligase
MTTSGSTGSPKFVRLSYSNLFDNATKISQYLNIQSSDRPITTMQPSYSYGLSIINSHLIKGASIIMTECTLFEKKFWDIFKKEKATTFGGVPFIFEILKKIKFNKMNLPYLNYITQAGGKLNKYLLGEFIKISEEKKIKFYVMYGATEATARMSYLDCKWIKKKFGSIGKPLKEGKFYICNDKNTIIKKSNTVGELIYEGNNVMLGYAEKIKDLGKQSINKKKLHTGDLAKRDEDGFYYITGRKNRYLKMFGLRINLDEIEQQIKSTGIDAACFGSDDNLNIFITNSRKRNFITKFLTQNLKINKSSLSINTVKKIPRNQDGKILYSNLKNIIA